MAYENSALYDGLSNQPVSSRFDRVVAFEMHGEWQAVEDALEAERLLSDEWPDKTGPSCKRALAACDAYLDGGGSPIGARAAFTVAVMEIGLPFRLFDDAMAFLDFQVEAMTEKDVRRQSD